MKNTENDNYMNGNENEQFVKSLEAALCDQLKGGVELACEAVFGMKVLLALENRMNGLENLQ